MSCLHSLFHMRNSNGQFPILRIVSQGNSGEETIHVPHVIPSVQNRSDQIRFLMMLCPLFLAHLEIMQYLSPLESTVIGDTSLRTIFVVHHRLQNIILHRLLTIIVLFQLEYPKSWYLSQINEMVRRRSSALLMVSS